MISTSKKKEKCSVRVMGNQLHTGERVSTGFSGKVEALKQAKEKGKGWSTPRRGQNLFIQNFNQYF